MNSIILLLLFSFSSWSKPVEVLVGGYEFPPYVMNSGDQYEGLTLDFIALLNQKQTKYQFVFVPTTSSRRYHDLNSGKYQIMVFESKKWGWTNKQVEASKIFRYGAEVYVANKELAKDQSYFGDLTSRKIKGMQGYHYGFLGLSTSNRVLKDFNVEFTNTLDGNIRSVVLKRADIAVAAKEYLDIYLMKHPEDRDKILISKKYDQMYELGALLSRTKCPITTAEMNRLIDLVLKDGSWPALLKEKGITEIKL